MKTITTLVLTEEAALANCSISLIERFCPVGSLAKFNTCSTWPRKELTSESIPSDRTISIILSVNPGTLEEEAAEVPAAPSL